MPTLDVFAADGFTVASLTAAIQDAPYVPGTIAGSGLFREEGITTTNVQIESDGKTLGLVANAQRGSVAPHVAGDKRKLRAFITTHLPQTGHITADEIMNLRAFGSQSELETVQGYVNQRLAKFRRNLDATTEHLLIGAVKGTILDADGSTVIYNLFTEFGVTQNTVAMALGTQATNLRGKSLDVLEKIEDELGGLSFTGVTAWCGKTFWRDLINHDKVKETYLASQGAATLRGDAREEFEFGGITWKRYRGKVAGVAFVGDDEAYAVPVGVPDLFLLHYAPADYVETVGTVGLPYYAKQEMGRMGKSVDVEAQSNPLPLCTRPKAVIKLTKV